MQENFGDRMKVYEGMWDHKLLPLAPVCARIDGRGHNWNDVVPMHKRGALVRRIRVERRFSATEIEELPKHHEARKNPDLRVTRTDVRVLDLGPLARYTHEERVAHLFTSEWIEQPHEDRQ